MVDLEMIELHSHILPQFDDGSTSVEMSLAMLQKMAEQGVATVCATSHYYADENSISAFCERRAQALKKLLSVMPQELPQILPAAEVAYYSHISEEYDLERLCIADTRTLMLEMPFCEWNDFQVEEVSTLALDLGFNVVLVHPERFCFSKGNIYRLERLAQLPIGMQVNTSSLIHWRTRKKSLEILQMTERPLLGSDCHNLTTRPPNLKEGRNIVKKNLGEDFLQILDDGATLITGAHAVS